MLQGVLFHTLEAAIYDQQSLEYVIGEGNIGAEHSIISWHSHTVPVSFQLSYLRYVMQQKCS